MNNRYHYHKISSDNSWNVRVTHKILKKKKIKMYFSIIRPNTSNGVKAASLDHFKANTSCANHNRPDCNRWIRRCLTLDCENGRKHVLSTHREVFTRLSAALMTFGPVCKSRYRGPKSISVGGGERGGQRTAAEGAVLISPSRGLREITPVLTCFVAAPRRSPFSSRWPRRRGATASPCN